MNSPGSNSVFSSYRSFKDPFNSIASTWTPTNMREMFRVCEWMMRHNSTLATALNRVANLFVTSFDYGSNDNTKTIDEIKRLTEGCPSYVKSIVEVGVNYLCYGNAFVTVYLPFKRLCRCPSCKNTLNAEAVTLNYNLERRFYGDCACGAKNVDFVTTDIVNKDITKVRLKSWNPKQMEIIHNDMSQNSTYFYTLEGKEREKYINGDGTILIRETHESILEAAHKDFELEFDSNYMLHLKQSSLAGMNIDWGTPQMLATFPLIFYIAVLRKANEAISMDYIIPMRILYPQSVTSNQEAALYNKSNVASKLRDIVFSHRKDPAGWYTTPGPIGYQLIGGEKQSLMITDDLKLSNDELLNSFGFPAELFYGTLNLQSTPMALRLLENTFKLTDFYNHVVKWSMSKILPYVGLSKTEVGFVPLTWADDMEKRQILLTLAASQKVSDITALRMFGIDYENELVKKMEQMNILNKVQSNAQADAVKDLSLGLSNQAQNPNLPQSALGGNYVGGSSQDIVMQARELAQQLYAMPYEQRRSELANLQKTNMVLYSQTKTELGKLSQQMDQQGGMMLQQQMQQGGGGMPMV